MIFNLSTFAIATICVIVGMLAGGALAYAALEEHYRKMADDIQAEADRVCLETIRENYEREQKTRQVLLNELGVALDADVVYLPSFGFVTLDEAAFQIPEDIIGDA